MYFTINISGPWSLNFAFLTFLTYNINWFVWFQRVLLTENMSSEQRRENYLCDITYVTNSELGFDYLRDNLATESKIFPPIWIEACNVNIFLWYLPDRL